MADAVSDAHYDGGVADLGPAPLPVGGAGGADAGIDLLPSNDRIGGMDSAASQDAANMAALHGVSADHYRFMQESSRWSRDILPFEPQTPPGRAMDKIVANPDGTQTYHANGYQVTYHNDFPDFTPYVRKNGDGERIEAEFRATTNRGADKRAWHEALAEKGMRQPKGTDFHHGPCYQRDGVTYILGQALDHEPHHTFPHAGGFAVSKAAAGMYKNQGSSQTGKGKDSHRRKGRKRRSRRH
ncbi:MAG: hypothetical protein ACOCXA_01810 [Planctomycetota bacterium]